MSTAYLTISESSLLQSLIDGLGIEGYSFDPKHQTVSEFFAAVLTDLGTPTSIRQSSFVQLLAGLAGEYATTQVSASTNSVGQILSVLYEEALWAASTAGEPIGLLLILTKAA